MNEQREESEYDRKSRERREADDLDRENKLNYIEKYIAPLAYQPPNQGETQRPINRVIITPDCE